MLTTFLILVYFGSVFAGVYLFDYQVDTLINNPFVIIGSIFGALIVTFIVIIIFLETTYFFIAKRYPTTSKLKHYFGKQIVSVPMHLGRIKTIVTGKEHLPQEGSFLLYSNHTSELDISVIMCHLPEYPIAFLAKEQVGSYLSIGKWALSIGCVFLNRENNRQGNEAISKVIENVQKGSVMAIFPEGTFERKVDSFLKFRSGAFKIALESGVPLVPITLVKEAKYHKKKWPMKKHLDLVIHRPLDYDSFKDLSSRQLGQRVREIIGSSLNLTKKT